MSSAWTVVALTSATAVLARELFGLVRYLRRRASIERIATQLVLPGSRLVDEDEHGSRFVLTVSHPQAPSGSSAAGAERHRAA